MGGLTKIGCIVGWHNFKELNPIFVLSFSPFSKIVIVLWSLLLFRSIMTYDYYDFGDFDFFWHNLESLCFLSLK